MNQVRRLLFFVFLSLAAAKSLAGESVVIGDREWLQPADFVDFTPLQVATVCPQSSGMCAGTLPGSSIDLTGYRWASSSDIAALLTSINDGTPVIVETDLSEPWDVENTTVDSEHFFTLFEPTYTWVEDGPQLSLAAFTRYFAQRPLHFRNITVLYGFAYPDSIAYDDSATDTGVWFWKPVEGSANLSGTVETHFGQDICAVILASGQHRFSCDPPGSYYLKDLPTETDRTVRRQVYASGFFPSIEVLEGTTSETIVLERAANCASYNLASDPIVNPESAGKRHSLDGRVLLQNTDTPVCAFVLANGQNAFSCNDEGSFSLEFPLDSNGQYTVQTYASGFAPSVQTFDEFSNPQEIRMARASECESGDFPEIVVADGKEWLQPDLLAGLSWDEINAACPLPDAICSGYLNGYDVNGFMWASLDDVSDLLVSFGGPRLTYPPEYHDGGTGSEWAPAFFERGFRSNFVSAGRAHLALTSTYGGDCSTSASTCSVEVRIVDRADDTVTDFVELGLGGSSRGVWLYKP